MALRDNFRAFDALDSQAAPLTDSDKTDSDKKKIASECTYCLHSISLT